MSRRFEHSKLTQDSAKSSNRWRAGDQEAGYQWKCDRMSIVGYAQLIRSPPASHFQAPVIPPSPGHDGLCEAASPRAALYQMQAQWAGGKSRRPLFFNLDLERPILDASAFCFAAVLVQGRVQALDQGLFVERLCQKADRAVVKRLPAGGLIGNRGDEYKRYLVSLAAQTRLQFDTAHSRHTNVGDHATGFVQLSGLQECGGGAKCADNIPERSDEVVQAGANRCIIVNDRNHRCYGQNTVLHRERDPRLLTRIASKETERWYSS